MPGKASGLIVNAGKTTGSYYTPDSLVQAMLDSALDGAAPNPCA